MQQSFQKFNSKSIAGENKKNKWLQFIRLVQ